MYVTSANVDFELKLILFFSYPQSNKLIEVFAHLPNLFEKKRDMRGEFL